MHKYHDIEKANNALETADVPVDIQSRPGQARLRRFAWFILEETAEALEARQHKPTTYEEELSDILHFMTEWAILSGVEADDIVTDWLKDPSKPAPLVTLTTDFAPRVTELLQNVGMSINLLKGKPWKQDYKPTDPELYRSRVVEAFHSLLKLIHYSGLHLNDIESLYFRKNKINHTRIAGGY